MNYLRRNDFRYVNFDLELILNRFDRDKDGRMTFSEVKIIKIYFF